MATHGSLTLSRVYDQYDQKGSEYNVALLLLSRKRRDVKFGCEKEEKFTVRRS